MNRIRKWLIAGALGVAVVAGASFAGGASEAKVAEARRLVAEGATLLDVRTPEEFAAGHIPGAVNIPVQDLEKRLGEVPKDEPVVVYCRSGNRSARAERILEAAGHEQVIDIGGMSSWNAK